MPIRWRRCAGANRSVGARALVGAEVAGDRAGGDVAGAAVRGGSASARACEICSIRISDSKRKDRYIAWINPMLGNYKPEQMEPMFRQIDDRLLADSWCANGGARALCADDGRQLERRHSHRRQAGARRQGRHGRGMGTSDAGLLRDDRREDRAGPADHGARILPRRAR